MVGLWFLVPAIGVRVPDRQRAQKMAPSWRFFLCLSMPRQGRERRKQTVWETV